jgi:cytochrome c biogenesis protein CcmG/thiol:disulfide interchange protein DsbE
VKRWVAIIPIAVVVLAVLMFGLKSLHRQSHVEPTAMVGKPVPVVSLQPLEGGPAADLGGVIKGPALVNLFASWCAPCAIEHPYLMGLKAKGARIIGIAYEDKPVDTANFLTRNGDPYELVLNDPTGTAGVNFGISGISETFLVDSAGKILWKTLPMTTQAEADDAFQRFSAAK